MPRKTIYEARTERLEILGMNGRVDQALMPDLTPEQFHDLYSTMVRMRKFDEKALNLQRQGRIGTYASLRGQEAAQAGVAVHFRPEDWMVPSFREHGIMIRLGLPMRTIYGYWKGDERTNHYPEHIRCIPPAVPVGSQLLHAAGVGMGLKLRGEEAIAVGFVGDGATSEGDFHEALNFAGVFKARTLFFIQNNQWAISVPFKKQTAAESLAQRAHGYGLPGIQVDGNDVLAVYAASKEAFEHVQSGKGPYLVEALTFRMGDHTTADDQSKYRNKKLVQYWAKRDPIDRMRKFMLAEGLWSGDQETALHEEISEEIETEVKEMESMPAPEPVEMFDSMYDELPWNLREQRKMFE